MHLYVYLYEYIYVYICVYIHIYSWQDMVAAGRIGRSKPQPPEQKSGAVITVLRGLRGSVPAAHGASTPVLLLPPSLQV